ncbi:DUF2628 domain-containing protein [Rhizobium sp. KVB221]|uniref:DUF2628 domain-containing protein n=1 Tax=Rhizobium setariae TaxID=2801340 RepID=A0A937CNV8_9HYPH|nr:DUF2628 domain-containing protein [Rhizobium setariae]MBL0374196.1 DUF2628 domain-containing protein [Rhizobium setariae]
MANFYVLTPPVPKDLEKDTLFIRDGFSWLAFLFPLPWLLFMRMWLIAGLAAIFYLVVAIAAEQWNLEGLPIAFSFILSLWTALEGNYVRARMLERKGWDIKADIAASDLDEAEEIYFTAEQAARLSRPYIPRLEGYGAGKAPVTLALGLIGSNGDR